MNRRASLALEVTALEYLLVLHTTDKTEMRQETGLDAEQHFSCGEFRAFRLVSFFLFFFFFLSFGDILVVVASFPLGDSNWLKPKLLMGAELTNFPVQNHFLREEALKLLKQACL